MLLTSAQIPGGGEPMAALPALAAHPRPWTVEEWTELVTTAEDGCRYELLEGAILVSPSPTLGHQYAADELRVALRNAAPPHLVAVTGVGIPMEDAGLIPDILVVDRSVATEGMPSATAVHLTVEVVSPSSRATDRTVKPEKYAAAGVPHHWRLELRRFRGQLAGERLPVLFAYTLGSTGEYELVQRVNASVPARLEHPFPVELNLADLLP